MLFIRKVNLIGFSVVMVNSKQDEMETGAFIHWFPIPISWELHPTMLQQSHTCEICLLAAEQAPMIPQKILSQKRRQPDTSIEIEVQNGARKVYSCK